MKGSSLRRKSGLTRVTAQAPLNAPTPAATTPGMIIGQVMLMRRLYCQVDIAVPQTAALLLVPNRVAGAACGKAANIAGTRISPPPPTMASTKPARAEARETKIHSMMGADCALLTER